MTEVTKSVDFFAVNIKEPLLLSYKKNVNSEGVVLIGELMLAKISELFGGGVNSVGGLESGALPITTAIVLVSNQLREGENKLTGFFVRKEAKRHGLQKKIEGLPKILPELLGVLRYHPY